MFDQKRKEKMYRKVNYSKITKKNHLHHQVTPFTKYVTVLCLEDDSYFHVYKSCIKKKNMVKLSIQKPNGKKDYEIHFFE